MIRHQSGGIGMFLIASCLALVCAPPLLGQSRDYPDPLVARVEMRLQAGEDVIDVIEKGDLLTVLEAKKDAYVVATFNGKKAVVDKANAVRLAESVEIYNELLGAKPKEHRLYTLRASAWWARGEEKKALADYDRAIQLGDQRSAAYSSRGMFHAALGSYEKALADYDQAIKLGAKNESVYINRAAVHMAQANYKSAIADYDEAIRVNPKRPSVYQQRAVAKKVNDQLDDAVADFGKALELDAGYVPALMGRGFLWFQKGDHRQAIADFTAVIKINPKVAQAYNNRGYNRQMLGEYRPALADYDEAIRVAPKLALAFQNKAWLLATVDDAQLRQPKQAIEMATKACELNDYKNPGDLRALAAAFAAAAQFETAIGWQEKVIEQMPDEEKAGERRILELYQSGQPYPMGTDESK